MADALVTTKYVPCMSYEHRNKDGILISKGRQFLKKGHLMHFVQETANNRKIAETITDINTGRILEEIKYDKKGAKASHYMYTLDSEGNEIKKEVTIKKWLLW